MIILFIDNYDVIREVGADLEEFLIKLTRDGTGVGIYTVITASRTNAVRYSVLNNFKKKIAQFMIDNADITSVVGRCAYKLPEIHGRALFKMKDAHMAQCYLPVEYENDQSYANRIGEAVSGISAHNSAPRAAGIRVVPDIVTYDDLIPFLRTKERLAAIGFDTETTDPLYLDLGIPCQMIVGGPSTGKTNLLKLLLLQLKEMTLFVADSRAADLHDFEGLPGVTYMSAESQLDGFYQALKEEVERRKWNFKIQAFGSGSFARNSRLRLC